MKKIIIGLLSFLLNPESSTVASIRIQERGGKERLFGQDGVESRERKEKGRNLQFSTAAVGVAGSARLPLLTSGFRKLEIVRERLSAK